MRGVDLDTYESQDRDLMKHTDASGGQLRRVWGALKNRRRRLAVMHDSCSVELVCEVDCKSREG